MVEFEWDEDKRLVNIEKHDADFQLVDLLFDGRPTFTLETSRNDEVRFVTTSAHDGRFYTVVWTWRGSVVRIISLRRARNAEKREYRAIYG